MLNFAKNVRGNVRNDFKLKYVKTGISKKDIKYTYTRKNKLEFAIFIYVYLPLLL